MGQNMWGRSCALVAALAVILSGQLAAADEAPKAAEKAKRPSPGDRVARGDAERRIERVLDERLQAPVEYADTPLNIITQEISETYDIPILFDEAALEAVASSPEVETSIKLASMSLRSALNLMLQAHEDLTYIVDNEVLLVTTQEEEQRRQETRVYRIDDLLSKDPRADWGDAGDFDSLIDTIVSTIAHDSWQENGTGDGEILPYHPGMLVIAQTRRVHAEIERLLDAMRQTKAAVEGNAKLQAEAVAGKPVTQGFPVGDAALTDTEEERAVVEDVLLRSVDWSPGDAGLADDQVFIHVLPKRVIVRHAPRVVDQVGDTVRKISATSTGGRGGAGGSGGGGGSDLADQSTSREDGESGGRGGGFF